MILECSDDPAPNVDQKPAADTTIDIGGKDDDKKSPAGNNSNSKPVVKDGSIDLTVSTDKIFVSTETSNTCSDIIAKFMADGAPAPKILFTVTLEDSLNVLKIESPATASSDKDGEAKFKVCSSSSALGDATVVITAESAEEKKVISVINRPTHTFKYIGSTVTTSATADVLLNLFDAGDDCAKLLFQLKKDEVPLAGVVQKFISEDDFPIGLKLAEKKDEGTTEANEQTGKTYAYYEATSNDSGTFEVPICSGYVNGQVKISSAIVDEWEEEYKAESTPVKIDGGLSTYGNFSVEYPGTNYRVLRVNPDQDTSADLKFKIKLGTLRNDDPVSTEIVSVLAERGKVEVTNGGIPDTNGEVNFNLSLANLSANRPVSVYSNASYGSNFPTQCTPISFNQDKVLYQDLAKNYRISVMYYVKGQEQFFDFNNNKKYDVGGDGYWDKDQNGQFNSTLDEITNDQGADGQINASSEYFYDLPTPFVDANENGIFDSGAGEDASGITYTAPNGAWDGATQIWKSFVVPLFTGVNTSSVKSMYISQTLDNTLTETFNTYANQYWIAYLSSTPVLADFHLFTENLTFTADGTEQAQYQYFFGQGACGGPLPGEPLFPGSIVPQLP